MMDMQKMVDVFFSTNLSVRQVSNDAYWVECNLLKNHSRYFEIEKVRRASDFKITRLVWFQKLVKGLFMTRDQLFTP